jgi:O-antigen ligase
LASKTFIAKDVVTLLIGAVGLVPLVCGLSERRHRTVRLAALAFLLVSLAAALSSRAPAIGIFGLYDWGTGWLLWLGCAGAFGVGLQLRKPDLELLFKGLLAGALVNALLALYQTLATPSSATFGPYQGNQADGLLGNPVFLESLLLGVVALVAVRAVRSPVRTKGWVGWLCCLGLLSVALEFTLERAAVIALAGLFSWLLYKYRLRGLFIVASVVCGYVIGYLGAGSDLGSRLAKGTNSVGYHQRLQLWHFGLEALFHRPVLGYGPSQLMAATAPRLNEAFARLLQPGRMFTDAHNVVVEVAVTTGLLGLACFLAWVVTAVLQSRNSMVLFAIMGLAIELVEPLNVAITPLVFLTLAAALVDRPVLAPEERLFPSRLVLAQRLAVGLLAATALGWGGVLVAGDVALNHAPPDGYSLGQAKEANRLLFFWPDSALALTDYYRYKAAALHTRAEDRYLRLAVETSHETVRRLPFDPLLWVALGDNHLALGQYRAATVDYRHALELYPWCSEAFDGLARSDAERHRFGQAERWYRRELSVLQAGPLRRSVEAALVDAKRHFVAPVGLRSK